LKVHHERQICSQRIGRLAVTDWQICRLVGGKFAVWCILAGVSEFQQPQ
jgi:hypothetical protein